MPPGIGYPTGPSPWSRIGGMLMGWGQDFNQRRDANQRRTEDIAFRDTQATADQEHRGRVEALQRAIAADQGVALPEPGGAPTIAGGPPVGGTGTTVAPPSAGVPTLSPRQQRELAEQTELQRLADERAAAERTRRAGAVSGAVASTPRGTFLAEPDAIGAAVSEGLPITAFQAGGGTAADRVTESSRFTQRARLAHDYLDGVKALDAREAEAIAVGYPPDSPEMKALEYERASHARRFPSIRSVEDATAIIFNEEQRGRLPEPGQQPTIDLGAGGTFMDMVRASGATPAAAPAPGPRAGPTAASAAALPEPAGGMAPLAEQDRARARTDAGFAAWLKSKGYSEADWR